MLAAIFGLVGVIIGVVLAGLFALHTERRRDFRAARVGARLVLAQVIDFLDDQSAEAQASMVAEWKRHRELLAGFMSAAGWDRVDRTFRFFDGSIASIQRVVEPLKRASRDSPFHMAAFVESYRAERALAERRTSNPDH